MKKYFIGIIAFSFVIICNAQIKGITDQGENVLLFSNGTWKYENDSLNKLTTISNNNILYLKDKKASFLVKSNKTNVGVWINPKKWSFKKAKPTSPSEYTFTNKDEDLYAMLIAEKTQIPLESLVDIAYDNAKNAAPDIKIIQKEYRIVNGLKVIMMQMNGTIQGIKFTYFGYYYSNESGSIQFITYISQNLFEQSKEQMEKFLNGIVEL